ncbi:MAG: hypothetical protein LBL62_10510 [Planctomycetaceae bacterium]|nr:hypothetical protein [Planctomycetaceae bacterium]
MGKRGRQSARWAVAPVGLSLIPIGLPIGINENSTGATFQRRDRPPISVNFRV